jgi:TRAP-type C4-dicarboxylate transport system substrate-binding protein
VVKPGIPGARAMDAHEEGMEERTVQSQMRLFKANFQHALEERRVRKLKSSKRSGCFGSPIANEGGDTMKRSWIVSLCLFLSVCLVLFSSWSVAAEKTQIRIVTAWSEKAVEHYGFFLVLDELKKRLGNRVEFKYLGGPEVVPYFDQYEMLSKGVFELGHLPGNMAKNFVPVADALHLHRLTPWELRSRGAYDIFRKAFEDKFNLVFLGTTAGRNYMYILYSNFEAKSLADFKGKTFRVAPVYVPLLKTLGAGTVTMPTGEVYTAMERKVVDGFGWPTIGPLDFGWQEVTKFRIDPPFYPVDVNIYFNKTAFYKLPQDVQKEIEKVVQDVEKQVYEKYGELVAKEEKGLQEKGMKFVKLPPADAKKFLEIAMDEGWKEVMKGDPERGKKLQEILK